MAYCFNCFKVQTRNDPCPDCGYDPAQDDEKYPHALPHGSILAGQYITGHVLGQGGFGITYLALDNNSGELVALKEFLPDTMAGRISHSLQVTAHNGDRGEQFQYGLDCFLEEAKTLAKFISNPNIVGVRSYFQENGTAYFAMDYIEGISFKAYLREHGGHISWEDAARILLPVVEALEAVHQEGLIHRDVTPDNIYISNDGTVKLLDFGAARYSMGDRSQSLDVVLKPGYAPKEQYTRRGKQGPYTDVYSLAACFYAAITGYLPPESLERTESDDLIPPSGQGVQLPSALEKVILYGLAVQPADRYQSMDEFRMALDTALERGEVVLPSTKSVNIEAQTEQKSPPQKKVRKLLRYFWRVVSAIVAVFAICLAVELFQMRTIQVTDRLCDEGIYTGSWSNGKPDGMGTMIYNNGDIYIGEWGAYSGKDGVGTMTYANGDVYEGRWMGDHKYHEGKMVYANGDIYNGSWSRDEYSGIGTMTYANGDVYEGEWLVGKKSGEGKMAYANGDIYEGRWMGDQKYHEGKMVYANGDIYNGSWSSDEYFGIGTMTYANGDVYEGNWMSGEKYRTGTMTYANGDVYEGNWMSDEKYRTGTMTYANGDVYKGEWSSDKKNGEGIMTYANGDVYEGSWSLDRRFGNGILTTAAGIQQEGYWIDDQVY